MTAQRRDKETVRNELLLAETAMWLAEYWLDFERTAVARDVYTTACVKYYDLRNEFRQLLAGPVLTIDEVNRRADRVRRGEPNGKPWPAVRDELLAKFCK